MANFQAMKQNRRTRTLHAAIIPLYCAILFVDVVVVVAAVTAADGFAVVVLQISKDSGTGIVTKYDLANCKFPACSHLQLEIWFLGQSNRRTSFL